MSLSAFEKMREKIKSSSKTINSFNSPEPEEEPIDQVDDEIEEIAEEDKEKKEEQYRVFFPKQDITTYDMARILALTQLLITEEMYQKYPPDLQKYFVKFEEVKPENTNTPA